MVARLETPSPANSKWDYSPCLNCSIPSFLLLLCGEQNSQSKCSLFLQTQLTQASHPLLHFQSSTMFPHALTRSPNPKANPPTTPCVKPTKQMATYVATPGDFAAPFDPVKNAVLLFNTLLSMLQCLTLLLTLKLLQLRQPRRALSPL